MKKQVGPNEVSKESRFRVIGGQTASFNIGDVIKPVKVISGIWQIGHTYRESLPFVHVEGNRYICESRLTPGKILAEIELIK